MDICRPNLIWINGSCYRKNQASDSTEFDHENTPTGGDAIGKKHALIKYDQFVLNTSCFWGKVLDQILPQLCNLPKF